jgi:FkbM family methyltransferase
MWRTLVYYDEHGTKIRHLQVERQEQILAEEYIQPDDTVLELGARYGTVSCVINKKLNDKTRQVVVEPDNRVWDALNKNKERNNCFFHILQGFISRKKRTLTELEDWKGYGTSSVEDTTSTIPTWTLEDIQDQTGLQFNVLVADCEGYLETFLDENPTFLDGLRCIIFEKDKPKVCNYKKIQQSLTEKGFIQRVPLFREVWTKET